MQIDHINCNKADNRFSNLRDVSANVNQQNKNCQSRSSSGLKGVTWHKAANKWQAQIKTGEKTIYIGIFDTKEAAFDKYKEAASVYHTHNRVVLQS